MTNDIKKTETEGSLKLGILAEEDRKGNYPEYSYSGNCMPELRVTSAPAYPVLSHALKPLQKYRRVKR